MNLKSAIWSYTIKHSQLCIIKSTLQKKNIESLLIFVPKLQLFLYKKNSYLSLSNIFFKYSKQLNKAGSFALVRHCCTKIIEPVLLKIMILVHYRPLKRNKLSGKQRGFRCTPCYLANSLLKTDERKKKKTTVSCHDETTFFLEMFLIFLLRFF